MKLAIISIVLTTCTLNFAQSAYALPGQDITTVIKWSERHPILSKLNYAETRVKKDEPDYYTEASFNGGISHLRLNVWVNAKKKVTLEEIQYTSETSLMKCNRNDFNFLQLIQQIYDHAIADDFRDSKYVSMVGEERFFKGKKYVYHTWDSVPNGNFQFTVIPPNNLESEMKQPRYCNTHECSP